MNRDDLISELRACAAAIEAAEAAIQQKHQELEAHIAATATAVAPVRRNGLLGAVTRLERVFTNKADHQRALSLKTELGSMAVRVQEMRNRFDATLGSLLEFLDALRDEYGSGIKRLHAIALATGNKTDPDGIWANERQVTPHVVRTMLGQGRQTVPRPGQDPREVLDSLNRFLAEHAELQRRLVARN